MTKTKRKRKEVDEVERLQKEVRELKQTIRALTKRLRKVDREYSQQIEEISKEKAIEEEKELPKKRNKCVRCERGHIERVDIVGRLFERCSVCDYRKRITS